MTDELKQRYADGESLDELLPEAFAAVREAAQRTIGQRHFDVQLMGGAALHLGNIAEMKTGEGKTLTGVLPAYLNALTGKGVHIVTVNDYLARCDSEWMGRIHRFLGLEVGVILADMEPDDRRKQYAADITYGTNNEFGFDYLRDNMAWGLEECVQRGHHFAIVDEVDSILIDEARTPLIISGPVDQNSIWYQEFARIAPAAAARRGRRGRLRGRREEADRRHHRGGHREGRGLARHRQPLRVDQHPADQLPEQRDQGQGAVLQGQGLRRDERRDPDRGRVHRPHPARPAVERGHAPGRGGQGGRGDQGREPDAGHHHAAELLPAVRQAGRDDRYGHHRGQRVPRDLQARRGADPHQQADDPGRRVRRRLPDRARPSTRRWSRTSSSGTSTGSPSWSARPAWRSPSGCPRR